MIYAPRRKGSEPMECGTLIIGGGLSGLRLASLLNERGDDFMLFEGRDRLGGRILSKNHQTGQFDLGPAWFWDGQPRIDALIRHYGLDRFEQYADGILTFEDEKGAVQRGRGFASMEGSFRLSGGLGALIHALADSLPRDRVQLSRKVTSLRRTADNIEVICADGQILNAHRVVLALPPRVAATLEFSPALSDMTIGALQNVATWMAGQAKAVAVYDKPFWREAGLSGDAMSRHGPMVEIHDASPAMGGPYALFGFIGVAPAARKNEHALRSAVITQFERLFGKEAATPRHLFLKDWAHDPFTSTALDHQPLYSHPTYGRPAALRDLWDNRLLFAGTEMAPQFGGYLEGALEAAEDALRLLFMEKV